MVGKMDYIERMDLDVFSSVKYQTGLNSTRQAFLDSSDGQIYGRSELNGTQMSTCLILYR